MRSLFFAGAVAMAATTAAAESRLRVEDLPGGGFRLTLAARGTADILSGQARVEAAARRLCGSEPARFGRSALQGSAAAGSPAPPPGPPAMVFSQDVACGGPEWGSAGLAADDPARALPRDDAAVTALTRRYFAVEESDHAAAYALWRPGASGADTLESWSEAARAFRRQAGDRKRRRVVRVTWYEDPPSTEPGVYAAVDYTAAWEKIPVECGYVIWQLQKDGQFRLTGRERNLLSAEQVAKANPDELAEMKAASGCPPDLGVSSES